MLTVKLNEIGRTLILWLLRNEIHFKQYFGFVIVQENWDDWLDDDEEQLQEKPLAKKLKKKSEWQELEYILAI